MTNRRPKSAISFLFDRANLVTLAGLLCGVSAIYFSALQEITAATIALLWALLCDWFDGPIARLTPDRTEVDRAFGAQLDSLADLVCAAVAPAAVLLSIGDFSPYFLPGAFILTLAGALRLAHFNLLDKGEAYYGLAIDTNIVVVTALLAFREPIGSAAFPLVLYAGVLVVAFLNVAPFRMPKPTRASYYKVAAYVLVMTTLNVFGIPGVMG